MKRYDLITEQFEPMIMDEYEPYKQQMKERFTGNECGSDEYRETQPGKGLFMVSGAVDMLIHDTSPGEAQVELLRLVNAWFIAIEREMDTNRFGWSGIGYAGADALVPVLERVFDIYWEHGEHPYYSTREEMLEVVRDIKEDEAHDHPEKKG